jgi:uncharacterized membrane protein YccC
MEIEHFTMGFLGFIPQRTQLELGLRMTLSAVLALFVAQAIGLPMPLWSVLTAVIVDQLSVGRSLKTSTSYLLGTIGGSVYGGIIAVLVPHSSEWMLLAVLILALAPLALYSAIHANMNAVPMSAIIVVLMPTLSNPVHAAIDRVIEVAVGAVVGLLVSFLVLPSSAHQQTRAAAAQTLEEMAQTLTLLVRGVLNGMTADANIRVQDKLGTLLRELETVGNEAEKERSARLTLGAATAPLRRTLLRLRHDLVFIGRTASMPVNEVVRHRLRPLLEDVEATGTAYMRACAAALREGSASPSLDAFQCALVAYDADVQAMRDEGLTKALSGEAAERFFAVSFALEEMSRELRDLQQLVCEWRMPKRSGLFRWI